MDLVFAPHISRLVLVLQISSNKIVSSSKFGNFGKTLTAYHNVLPNRLASTTARSSLECSVGCLETKCCSAFVFASETRTCELLTTAHPLGHNVAPTLPLSNMFASELYPKDCWDIYAMSATATSGVYNIYVTALNGNIEAVEVFCDMSMDGGGWTSILKRFDGSVNFYQDYANYTTSIGKAGGEHWMGLQNIHSITSRDHYEVRIDLLAHNGSVFAKYQTFSVNAAADRFRLSVTGYDSSSTAGNGLGVHNGRQFTARDVPAWCQGKNNHCGSRHKGAWWYACCYRSGSQLLSEYKFGPTTREEGLAWLPYKGSFYSMQTAQMMIRPAGKPVC